MNIRFAPCVLAFLICSNSSQAAPFVSHFPKTELGLFLANRFDLATIRSSFGPRRTPALRTFSDFGLKPSKATEDAIVFDAPGEWMYELKVVARRDVNRDGIEDLEACFTERALNGGTYNASKSLLITRYTAEGYAIALGYSLNDDVCEEFAR